MLWTASEHLVATRAAPDTVAVHVRVCRRTYVCMYVCAGVRTCACTCVCSIYTSCVLSAHIL